MTAHLTDQTDPAGLEGKYLTFRLGPEFHGIRAVPVREIVRQAAITAVPNTPPYVLGVIDLCGRVVPVLDLRQKLGLGKVERSDQACIVVVEVRTAHGTGRHMGLMVDGVEEATQIGAADLGKAPDFSTQAGIDRQFGMASVKGTVMTPLDIERVAGGEVAEASDGAVNA